MKQFVIRIQSYRSNDRQHFTFHLILKASSTMSLCYEHRAFSRTNVDDLHIYFQSFHTFSFSSGFDIFWFVYVFVYIVSKSVSKNKLSYMAISATLIQNAGNVYHKKIDRYKYHFVNVLKIY